MHTEGICGIIVKKNVGSISNPIPSYSGYTCVLYNDVFQPYWIFLDCRNTINVSINTYLTAHYITPTSVPCIFYPFWIPASLSYSHALLILSSFHLRDFRFRRFRVIGLIVGNAAVKVQFYDVLFSPAEIHLTSQVKVD